MPGITDPGSGPGRSSGARPDSRTKSPGTRLNTARKLAGSRKTRPARPVFRSFQSSEEVPSSRLFGGVTGQLLHLETVTSPFKNEASVLGGIFPARVGEVIGDGCACVGFLRE